MNMAWHGMALHGAMVRSVFLTFKNGIHFVHFSFIDSMTVNTGHLLFGRNESNSLCGVK